PLRISERVEAAAYHGKPVFFRVIYPWTRAGRDQAYQQSTHQKLANLIGIGILTLVIIGSIFVVRHNAKLKRGDEVGSARLGNFLFLTFLAMWVLSAHHLASLQEFFNLVLALAWAFLVSSFARLLYYGLEPFVRRRDPHILIGWTRLVTGEFR